MRRGSRGLGLLAAALLAAACASSRESSSQPADAARISPAELLASLADVAQGRNADLAETGLALKKVELKVVVGHDRRAGAHASFLVLDVESSRRSEVSFTQTFTFDLPPPERRRSAAPPVAVPGVVEFVDAAIATARELAAVAAREDLPQRLSEVELTAKIVRGERAEGGVAFHGLGSASLGGGVAGSSEESNTVKLVFGRR
jgi:hypothetical protein